MSPSAPPAVSPRVLLVGWDAADWNVIHPLLDRGELPTLARIIEGGVSGNLSSLQPMLWTSIATGRRAYEHGIHGFTEIEGETGRVQPVTSTLRPVKALWNILAQTGRRANVVSWFATHPAETLPHGGASVSDAFFALKEPPEGSVHPTALREELAKLRVGPEEIDANVVGLFVPDWPRADDTADGRLATLRGRLAECFSVHAAATHLLARGPADFTAVYYRAIDWVCHDFMPFHPPAMAGASAEDATLYGGVVNGIYRLLDLLLARLQALAGEDTTVVLVSDHGFHSDGLRPARTPAVSAGIADWHRLTGILARRGPALRWQQQAREDQLRRDVAARADARAAERARLVRHAAAVSPDLGPASGQPLDLLIVSGLPRSGTSLMMRMLLAAGMPLLVDGACAADDDNPDGYFEWQPIKELARQPALIEQAAGQAVNVVSALLIALPRRHRYRVIFMLRPVEEIAASQLRMRARLEPEAALPDAAKLADWLARHREGVLDLLRREPNVALHLVEYPALVRSPREAVANLRSFLELAAPETADRMLVVIDPTKQRTRLFPWLDELAG